MSLYLKVINPAIAVIVLLLCFWGATYDKSDFALYGLVAGNMSTYFFAKGLFSASAVFILGRILLEIRTRSESADSARSTRSEVLYCIGLVGLALSMLTGLFLLKDMQKRNTSRTSTITVINPKEIEVLEQYFVSGTQPLRIGGKFKNNSSFEWEHIRINARIYLDGKYAARCGANTVSLNANSTIYQVRAGTEHHFAAICHDLGLDRPHSDVKYELSIEGSRKTE